MIKTYDKVTLPVVLAYASIYQPHNNGYGQSRYFVSWKREGFSNVNAKTHVRPLVTLSEGNHAYRQMKELFDECDVRNVPREKCFLGVPLELLLTPFDYEVNGREGDSFFLEEIIVSMSTLHTAFGQALEHRRG